MAVSQRIMLFIDTPNLLGSAQDKGIPRIRFEELCTILAEKQRQVGCFCYVRENPEKEGFYAQLERMGLHVIRVSAGKSVDGRLIFDMLVGAMKDHYDIATLCAGDRDYVPVVEEVKRMKKTVWIAAFSHSVNVGLRSIADRFINLDDFIGKIKWEARF